MGLRRKGASGNATGISFSDRKRPWSDREDAIVREFFPQVGAVKVSAMLESRTASAIRHRAERLGVAEYETERVVAYVFTPPSMDDGEREACRTFTAAMRMIPGEGQLRARL